MLSLGRLEDGGHPHGLLEQQIHRMHRASLVLRIRSRRKTAQAPEMGTGGKGGRLRVGEGGRRRREKEDDCALGSRGEGMLGRQAATAMGGGRLGFFFFEKEDG
jgi:hypothetical protein